jgi:N-acetylglucosamine-6-phosphate deacetylase
MREGGRRMDDGDNFFDLQVNGYAGIDFNADDLDPARIATACERLEQDGVAAILATVITAEIDQMCRRIGVIARAVQESPAVARVIRGIHVEGPFISDKPGYVGTHPRRSVTSASVPVVDRLIDAGQGFVKLVTLAPEQDAGFTTTQWLTDHGIIASAGHCDPTIDQLRGAIDHGLSMFTHLGNGCPLLMYRHDNVIQRVLSLSSSIWVCFIADGVHVPFAALRNYLKLVGSARAIVVSDAISAAGGGPGRYSLGSMEVIVDDNLATWSSDGEHLMGSACPLHTAYQNLVTKVGVSPDDARRMTVSNPRRATCMIS